MKYLLLALGALVIVVGVTAYFFFPSLSKGLQKNEIRSFEECAEAGNLVVDTNPRECHTKNKQVFVEIYNGVQLKDVIEVTEPKPNADVSSPFKLTGQAVGGWYYNDILNVKLVDENDNVITTKVIKATSSTQTDSMVPFTAAIVYDATQSAKAKLIIERTNPSFSNGQLGPLIIPLHIQHN